MLERRSALASAKPYESPALAIAERGGFTLTQAAGLDDGFEAALAAAVGGALPATVGLALVHDKHTVFRIGPAQFWIVGPEADDLATRLQGKCAVTPLTHSRTRITLHGTPACDVLAKLMPVDFDPAVFTPGRVALTGLHHTPVTVHCTGPEAFDIYVMRTFALDVWDAVTDAAREFAASR